MRSIDMRRRRLDDSNLEARPARMPKVETHFHCCCARAVEALGVRSRRHRGQNTVCIPYPPAGRGSQFPKIQPKSATCLK
jgi:hypothetical protein